MTLVEKAMKRSDRVLLLASLFGIIVVVLAFVVSRNYYANYFNGPFEANSQDILAIDTLEGLDKYYLTVTGDDAADTGYQLFEVSDSGSRTPKANYHALLVGDKFLLVKAPVDVEEPQLTYTGSLVSIPNDTQRDVIADIERDFPRLKDQFLPYMLTTDDFKISGTIGLIVGGVVVLLCLYGLITWMRRRRDPKSHPIMRSLARYGDPEMVAEELQREYDRGMEKVGKLYLGQNWMYYQFGANFQVMKLSDLAWLYKKVVKQRGISTYLAFFYDKHGKHVSVSARQKNVDAMLEAVAQRAPWAIPGYTPEIDKTWRKDRAVFLAAVEERRMQASGGNWG